MNQRVRTTSFSVSSEEEKRQILARITQLDCWCSIRNDGAWEFEVREADFRRLFPEGAPAGLKVRDPVDVPLNATVQVGHWTVRAEEHGGMPYLYVSRDDKPGQLHLKAETWGYVADLWAKEPSEAEAVATATAPYDELVTDEDTEERRFGDLRVGAQFFDPKSGEAFEKVGEQGARCLSGGDAFEGEVGHFSVDDMVLYRYRVEGSIHEQAYRWPRRG